MYLLVYVTSFCAKSEVDCNLFHVPYFCSLSPGGIQTFRSAIDNNTYEAVWINGGSSIADDDACSWGSSEFESYDDEEDEAFSEHLQENAQSAKRHKSRRHSGKPDIKFKIPEVRTNLVAPHFCEVCYGIRILFG